MLPNGRQLLYIVAVLVALDFAGVPVWENIEAYVLPWLIGVVL